MILTFLIFIGHPNIKQKSVKSQQSFVTSQDPPSISISVISKIITSYLCYIIEIKVFNDFIKFLNKLLSRIKTNYCC